MTLRHNIWILSALLATSVWADELLLGRSDAPPGGTIIVPVTMSGNDPVVSIQFDLRYPSNHVTTAGAFVLSTNSDHQAATQDLTSNQVERVVVYSRTNTPMPPDIHIGLGLHLGTNSPSGGPSLTIENMQFTTASGQAIPSSVVYRFMERWRAQYFGRTERDDPLLVGDDRDPDGDRVPNLQEAFTGGNPRLADGHRMGPETLNVAPNGDLLFGLRFMQNRDAKVLDDLEVVAVTADSLLNTNWTSQGVTIVPTGGGDVTADELEAQVNAGGAPIRFILIELQRRP